MPIINKDGEALLYDPKSETLYGVPADKAEIAAKEHGLVMATQEQVDRSKLVKDARENEGLALAEQVPLVSNFTEGTDEQKRVRSQTIQKDSPLAAGAVKYGSVAAGSAAVGALAAPVLAGAGLSAGAATAGAIAAENVAAAAALEADQAFQENRDVSAEAILGNAALGTVLGLGAVRVGSLGRRNLVSEAGTKVEREAFEEVANRAGVETTDDLYKTLKSPETRNAAKVARDEAIAAKAPEVSEALSMAKGTADEILDPTVQRKIPGKIKDVDFEAQRAASTEFAESLTTKMAKTGDSEAEAFGQSVASTIYKSRGPDGVYQSLDRVERSLQHRLNRASDPLLKSELQNQIGEVRQLLSNEELFGEVAKNFKKFEQATDNLRTARSKIETLDPEFLFKVGTPAGKEAETAFSQFADSLYEVASLTGADKTTANGLRSLPIKDIRLGNQIDALEGPLGDAIKEMTPVQRLRNFARKEAKDVAKSLLGEVAESAIEKTAGKYIPGVGAIMKLRKGADIKSVIKEELAEGVVEFAAGKALPGLGTAIKVAKDPKARQLIGHAANAAVKPVSSALRRGAPISSFARDNENADQAYTRHKKALNLIAQDPEILVKNLADGFGDLPMKDEDLFSSLSSKTFAASQFLQSKLPVNTQYSLLHPDGPPPSRQEVFEFGLYYEGATNPRSVLKGIKEGTVTPQEMEAFQAVYPSWFQMIREEVFTALTEMAQEGKEPPGWRIAQMDLMLGLDGGLEPTFSWRVANYTQAASAAENKKQSNISAAGAPSSAERITQGSALSTLKQGAAYG